MQFAAPAVEDRLQLIARKRALLSRQEGVVEGGEAELLDVHRELARIDRELQRIEIVSAERARAARARFGASWS